MNRSSRIARSLQALTLAFLLPVGAGCQGWTMDYGKPAAQFESNDAVAIAQEYLGEKVSVRGEVLSVDISNPGSSSGIIPTSSNPSGIISPSGPSSSPISSSSRSPP